jgi:hypothetical protein
MIRGDSLTKVFIGSLKMFVRYGMQGRLLAFAVAAAVTLGGVGRAQAQFTIINPNLLPDLSVSVNAPQSDNAYTDFLVTASVAASAPAMSFQPYGSSGASLILDLSGYQVLWFSADPVLSCWSSQILPDWAQVVCSGSIAWGSGASVRISVLPAESYTGLCRPGYSDASVTATSGGDRNSANNRSIARTSLVNCLN